MCNIASSIFFAAAAAVAALLVRSLFILSFFHLAANRAEFSARRMWVYVCMASDGHAYEIGLTMPPRAAVATAVAPSAVADVREDETLNPFCWCVHTTATVASRSHISHSTLARNHEAQSRTSGKYSVRSFKFLSIPFLFHFSRTRVSSSPSLSHSAPVQSMSSRCRCRLVAVFNIGTKTDDEKAEEKKRKPNERTTGNERSSGSNKKKYPSFLEAKTFFCWTFFYHRSFSHVSSFPFSIFTFRFFFFTFLSFASYLHMTHTDCMQSPSSAREENISHSLYVDSETKKKSSGRAKNLISFGRRKERS